jgi:hypothetical protein
MMNDILNLLPDFETLLRTRSFTDLTSSEKSAVLKFMTIEEYAAMKSNTSRVIEAFSEEENHLPLDRNIENALVSRLHEKKKGFFIGITEILSLIFRFKIPVYQAAILLLVVIFLIPKPNSQMMTNIIPVSKIDTVFIEKSINSSAFTKNNIKTGNIHTVRTKRISNQPTSKTRPVLLNQSSPYFANIVTLIQNEKTGRPIESDPILYWRLVSLQLQGN